MIPTPSEAEVREALEYVDDPERYAKPAWWADKRLDVLALALRAAQEELTAEKNDRSVAEIALKAALGSLSDAKARMEAAERCSGEWMRDRAIAIRQRDKAEAQLSHFLSPDKPPIFIHAGEVCPNASRAEKAEAERAEWVKRGERAERLNDELRAEIAQAKKDLLITVKRGDGLYAELTQARKDLEAMTRDRDILLRREESDAIPI